MRRGTLAVTVLLLPSVISGDAILGRETLSTSSWNNDKTMSQVAHMTQHVDFLAIQELTDRSNSL
ncbi:hypothetical protein QC823_14100 [Halomonas vilamensis]|uniref:Uncharacterized protein n=1 Tax=Vreelandella vilamensis TaxID=531309 RepID=A0ABU1H736_9GAMM|nr:hypothetical protein [Halomonas vilamensis]MDR5900113.1 hypothetical protein [Halomonas vilamensis]